LQPRYSKAEFPRRADEIYEHQAEACAEDRDGAKFVAIDVETGAFEVDQVWLRQTGARFTDRFGLRWLASLPAPGRITAGA
jgi:D-Tyr-tRNAtyr deacylase